MNLKREREREREGKEDRRECLLINKGWRDKRGKRKRGEKEKRWDRREEEKGREREREIPHYLSLCGC